MMSRGFSIEIEYNKSFIKLLRVDLVMELTRRSKE